MNVAITPAYSNLYIGEAQTNIAFSFDYAVKGMKMSLEYYMQKFLSFKYLHLLENGNPHYTAGMSGVELAREICNRENEPFYHVPYSPELEYWIGYIISYYQWSRNTTYNNIIQRFPLQRLIGSYPTFHECNDERMYEYMDEVVFGDRK